MDEYGQGAGMSRTKTDPKIAARIEWLGRMSDRRRELFANRDIDGLRQLAAEYAMRNMIRTANTIYLEIDLLRKAHE